MTGDAKAVPPNVAEELYLILREATRNALRHARCASIGATIAIGDTMVRAAITDDGRGFVPAELTILSGGLSSMTERTELLRGRIAIESRPGAGTTVRVDIPLDGGRL